MLRKSYVIINGKKYKPGDRRNSEERNRAGHAHFFLLLSSALPQWQRTKAMGR